MAEAQQTVRVTPRQERLVEIYATGNPQSHTEALLKAGYSAKTARSDSLDIRERPGVVRAREKRESRQLDKARGLDAIIDRTIHKPELLDEVEPRDRLAIGLQAYKMRHDIGDVVESGDADAFREWRKGFMRRRFALLYRMHTSGVGPLGWRRTQDVVLSPRENASFDK